VFSRIATAFAFAFAISMAPVAAQDPVPEVPDELKEQTLFVSIRADLGSGDWSATSIRQTLSGTPVSAKITGANLVINIQINAYITPEKNILVIAQAEVIVMKDEKVANRMVSMSTMTVKPGESFMFYPLGQAAKHPLKLEIMVEDYRTFEARRAAASGDGAGN
jgi:hypothetical protein